MILTHRNDLVRFVKGVNVQNAVKAAAVTCFIVIFLIVYQYGRYAAQTDPFKQGTDVSKYTSLALMVQSSPTVWSTIQYDVHLLVLIHPATDNGVDLKGQTPTACIYGNMIPRNDTFETEVRSRAFKIQSDWTVVCEFPPEIDRPRLTKATNVTIEVDGVALPSLAKYPNKMNARNRVYASVVLDDHILLFAKGLNRKISRSPSSQYLGNSSCVFGDNYTTNIVDMCLENVLCELPPREKWVEFRGKPVQIWFETKKFSSVALFNPESNKEFLYKESVASLGKSMKVKEGEESIHLGGEGSGEDTLLKKQKHKICACTMIWNSARFVREWVMYHSRIGVSRFFFYDNNSDDNLEEEVEFLSEYNVTRHPWPWLKTQEAGFSHCAIRGEGECEWMAFIDVDEFLYPVKALNKLLNNAKSESDALQQTRHVLGTLIEDYQTKNTDSNELIGQLEFACRNFGPSGLEDLPRSGQIMNYICRESNKSRKKSIVLLEALVPTRCGVIHYFDLKKGYSTVIVKDPQAVIQHYKYQVWNLFVTRYKRRVATYVIDWTHLNRKPKKLDLPSGLAFEPIKPDDWEHRYCDVNDTSMREHVLELFPLKDGKLPWE